MPSVIFLSYVVVLHIDWVTTYVRLTLQFFHVEQHLVGLGLERMGFVTYTDFLIQYCVA